MGSGSSIITESPVDISQAQALAEDHWGEDLKSLFEAAQNDEGHVSASEVREFIKLQYNCKLPATLGHSPGSFDTSSDGAGKSVGRMVADDTNHLLFQDDMQDRSVQKLLNLISGTPSFSNQNLSSAMKSAAMSLKELQQRHVKRRSRVKLEAENYMASFELLSLEQRQLAINDGNMECYTPENQTLRESIFSEDKEVNHWLDRWWSAAKLYLDTDGNESLTISEYAVFHHRLCKFIEQVQHSSTEANDVEVPPSSGGGKKQPIMKKTPCSKVCRGILKSEEEDKKIIISPQMKIDFQVDSGEDGSVSCEEFRYSVFQLADQWTNTCEAFEYVQFLKQGYHTVFSSDLMNRDQQLKLPDDWLTYTKHVKGRFPIVGINKMVDTITSILYDKIKADKVDRSKGNKIDSFSEYAIEWFQTQYGSIAAKKKFKAFTVSLLKLLEDEDHLLFNYILLFAQLCGVESSSQNCGDNVNCKSNTTISAPPNSVFLPNIVNEGSTSHSRQRMVALPPSAGLFILSVLEEVLDLIEVSSNTTLFMRTLSDRLDTNNKHSDVPIKAASDDGYSGDNNENENDDVDHNSNSSKLNRRGSNDSSSKSHKITGMDAFTSRLLFGLIEFKSASCLFIKVLSQRLNLKESDPMYRVALLGLEALKVNGSILKKKPTSSSSTSSSSSSSAATSSSNSLNSMVKSISMHVSDDVSPFTMNDKDTGEGKVMDSSKTYVTCMEFTILLGVVFAAHSDI